MANMSPIMSGKLMPPGPKIFPNGELSAAGAAVWARKCITNMPLPFGGGTDAAPSRRRPGQGVPARELFQELPAERGEPALEHRRARAPHQRDHVVHCV